MSGSPYRSMIVGRALIVEWTGEPTAVAIDAIGATIEDLSHRCGARVLYLAVIDERMPLPNMEGRRAIHRVLGPVLSACERLDVVLLGTDVRMTLLRSFLRALTTGFRGSVSTFASVDEVFRAWRAAGIPTGLVRSAWRGFDDAPSSLAS